MRRVSFRVSRSVAVLALVVGGVGRAGAGPLDPLDPSFPLLGAFPTPQGRTRSTSSGRTRPR